MGAAIESRDSLPVMTTFGVSKLISDSGVVRYKIITEEWRVYDKTHPQRQEFPKGLYLERYDNNQRTNLHITADTAYCYDQNLWKMRGRVMINDSEKQLVYKSDELYWDMRKHIFYANAHFIIDEPTRHIEGNWFESDEQMKKINVKNSSGFMPFENNSSEQSQDSDSLTTVDTVPQPVIETPVPTRVTRTDIQRKPQAPKNTSNQPNVASPSEKKPFMPSPANTQPQRLKFDSTKTGINIERIKSN